MIVRIMGQGQWVMEPESLIALNELDAAVEHAVEAGDAEALQAALQQLAEGVRAYGTEVPDEVLAESDLVLPDTDATVEEVKALLDSTSDFYGLIPDAENFESEGDAIDPGTGFEGDALGAGDPSADEGQEANPQQGDVAAAPDPSSASGEISEADGPQFTDGAPTDVDATPEIRGRIGSLEEKLADDGFDKSSS